MFIDFKAKGRGAGRERNIDVREKLWLLPIQLVMKLATEVCVLTKD